MGQDTKSPIKRDPETGQILKGSASPHQAGRLRIPEEVKEMLTCATPKAAKRLIDALDAKRSIVVKDQIEEVVDHDMRVKAANAILDRRYGKPTQVITGEDGPLIPEFNIASLSLEQIQQLETIRLTLKAPK